jgi:hypothetical protein
VTSMPPETPCCPWRPPLSGAGGCLGWRRDHRDHLLLAGNGAHPANRCPGAGYPHGHRGARLHRRVGPDRAPGCRYPLRLPGPAYSLFLKYRLFPAPGCCRTTGSRLGEVQIIMADASTPPTLSSEYRAPIPGGRPVLEVPLWQVRMRLLWRSIKTNVALFAENPIGLVGLAIIILFAVLAFIHPVPVGYGLGPCYI